MANVPVPLPGDAAEGQPTAPPGVRVLVVDDDPRVCRSIANAMARLGFHVLTAEDGAPALELVARTRPDLALVDINMPTPGLDVVKRLKAEHGPAIYVAVLSGHDDDETRAACFEAGADDVLAKPANMAELRRRIVAAAHAQQPHVEARLARDRADRVLAYGAEAAALLAHELDGGLVAARAGLSSLQRAGQLGEDQARALAAADHALRRISALVSSFAALARFQDPAAKPQAQPRNVRALLQAVIEAHIGGPAGPARFELDCDPALAGVFDPALIERVLHVLIRHALRGPEGAIRLSARPWDPHAPSSVELTVACGGPPVPEPLRARLFDRDAADAAGGRDLGLFFCRLACEAHGGDISYRAIEGGAELCVRLPGRS